MTVEMSDSEQGRGKRSGEQTKDRMEPGVRCGDNYVQEDEGMVRSSRDDERNHK